MCSLFTYSTCMGVKLTICQISNDYIVFLTETRIIIPQLSAKDKHDQPVRDYHDFTSVCELLKHSYDIITGNGTLLKTLHVCHEA